jgi:hypothetical protein
LKASTGTSSIGRTTASHQISAKTDSDVIPKLRKGKTKGKNLKQHLEPEPEANSASDEDDSLEREAALSSPVTVKGIAARKANKASNQYFTSVINSDEP